MVRIWYYGEQSIPKEIADEAFRGGDEDYVISSPSNQEELFRHVCQQMDGSNFTDRMVSAITIDGKRVLVYTCCHA